MKNKTLIIWSVLLFVVFNYAIYEKEVIIKNGENILLELAPVDPRSLMQGDYMRLSYMIERDIPATKKRGLIVVMPDKNNVAKFVRVHDGENLAPGEKLLRYRGRQIVPRSFMFQEGRAREYSTARYGVFKFDGARKYILAGLADNSFKIIDPDTP